MVDQKEEAKKEKFIEIMPTMIQTHLIMCKDWATVKDTAKSLKHIILKCDPPTLAMPMMATGATVPGLYSHIAHSVDKDEREIPQLFKGAKPKQTRGRGKPKGKCKVLYLAFGWCHLGVSYFFCNCAKGPYSSGHA